MGVEEHIDKYKTKHDDGIRTPYTITYSAEEVMAEIDKYEHDNNILVTTIREGVEDINKMRIEIDRYKSKLEELHAYSEELEVIEKQLDEFLYYIETASKEIESDTVMTKSKIVNMLNSTNTLLIAKTYIDSKPEIRTKLETVQEVIDEATKYIQLIPQPQPAPQQVPKKEEKQSEEISEAR